MGKTITDEMLGIFAFALLVSTKIQTISDAITDVTLPSMTEVYEKTREKFKSVFLSGNSKAFLLITFASVMLVLLKREAFIVIDLIFSFIGKSAISEKYSAAFILMDPLILAFWAHSHINLLKSGLSVPSRKMFVSLVSYIVMFVGTIVSFNLLNADPLFGFALAMGIGASFGYVLFLVLINLTSKFLPFTKYDLIYSVFAIFVLYLYYIGVSNVGLAIIVLPVTYLLYVQVSKAKF